MFDFFPLTGAVGITINNRTVPKRTKPPMINKTSGLSILYSEKDNPSHMNKMAKILMFNLTPPVSI